MKHLRYCLLLVTVSFFWLILSCKNNQKEVPADKPVETYDDKTVLKPQDSIHSGKELPPIWEYDTELEIPLKIREIDTQSLTVQQLIDVMNVQYKEKVYLKYGKHSRDTLYVTIDKSNYLTQQMGTMGVDAYLSVATYTLTELEYINQVHFDFKEGDHAIPGVYSREYYINRNKNRNPGN